MARVYLQRHRGDFRPQLSTSIISASTMIRACPGPRLTFAGAAPGRSRRTPSDSTSPDAPIGSKRASHARRSRTAQSDRAGLLSLVHASSLWFGQPRCRPLPRCHADPDPALRRNRPLLPTSESGCRDINRRLTLLRSNLHSAGPCDRGHPCRGSTQGRTNSQDRMDQSSSDERLPDSIGSSPG